jgi:DNA processing protein
MTTQQPTPSERAARAALAAHFPPESVADDIAEFGAVDTWLRRAAQSPLALYRPESALARALPATFLIPGDPQWPARLSDLGTACPPGLWTLGAGNLSQLITRSVAVAGARNVTDPGWHSATEAGGALAHEGRAVVASLAYGVASAALDGAHAQGGQAVVVMPCGPDVCHPHDQTGLRGRVINRSGLLITPFAPGTLPSANNLHRAARLMAALASASLLIEPHREPNRTPFTLHEAAGAMGRRRVYLAPPVPPADETLTGAPVPAVPEGARIAPTVADVSDALT